MKESPQLSSRLQKILALLDSPHEGEAISALMTLRAQLSAQNLKLADLLSDPANILALENERLQQALDSALVEAETNRAAAAASRQARQREAASSDKWRKLAERTADQLWEIGRQLHQLDEAPENPVTVIKSNRSHTA